MGPEGSDQSSKGCIRAFGGLRSAVTMKRPEFLTSAILAVAGLALAFWLAANRLPTAPSLPMAPAEAVSMPMLPAHSKRELPAVGAVGSIPEVTSGHNGLPCGATLSARPAAPGFTVLSLTAPCRAGEVVEVSHGPIRFSERLSDRGTLTEVVPVIEAGLEYGAVLDGARLDTVAAGDPQSRVLSGVQWSSPLDLSLAAFEFGSAEALRADGPPGLGRILRLGQSGLGVMTELYIGPEEAGPGVVRLHVEARIDPEACDAPQPLQVFDAEDGKVAVRDIRLRLAGCDGAVRRVLLKNLVDDLKIAGR